MVNPHGEIEFRGSLSVHDDGRTRPRAPRRAPAVLHDGVGAPGGRRGGRRRDGHGHDARPLRPSHGQALRRRLLPRRRPGPRHARLQLPRGRGHGHGPRRRLRGLRLRRGLRRLPPRAGSRDAARVLVAREDGARPVRRARRRDGRARRRRAAVRAPGPARRRRRRGPRRRERRVGARVLYLRGQLQGRARQGPRQPRAHRPVRRGLPPAPGRAHRVLPPPRPPRAQSRGHGRRDVQGRGGQGPARAQRALRRRAGHGRQPRRLQAVPQGDRGPGGHLRDVHGQAVRGRAGQLVPHPLLAHAARRLQRLPRRPRPRARRAPARRAPPAKRGGTP